MQAGGGGEEHLDYDSDHAGTYAMRPRTPVAFPYDHSYSGLWRAGHYYAAGYMNAQQARTTEQDIEGEGEEGEVQREEAQHSPVSCTAPPSHVIVCYMCDRFMAPRPGVPACCANMCVACYPAACMACGRPVYKDICDVWLQSSGDRMFCASWGCREWAPLHARDGEEPVSAG